MNLHGSYAVTSRSRWSDPMQFDMGLMCMRVNCNVAVMCLWLKSRCGPMRWLVIPHKSRHLEGGGVWLCTSPLQERPERGLCNLGWILNNITKFHILMTINHSVQHYIHCALSASVFTSSAFSPLSSLSIIRPLRWSTITKLGGVSVVIKISRLFQTKFLNITQNSSILLSY